MPLEATFPSHDPTPEDIRKWMNLRGIFTREQVEIGFQRIKKQAEEAESTFMGKLIGQLYWNLIKPSIKITPATLIWILANFDQLLEVVKIQGFWKDVVVAIDTIGEQLQSSLKT